MTKRRQTTAGTRSRRPAPRRMGRTVREAGDDRRSSSTAGFSPLFPSKKFLRRTDLDVAGAHRQHDVALAGAPEQRARVRPVGDRSARCRGRAPPPPRHELAGDALDRLLARAVDVGARARRRRVQERAPNSAARSLRAGVEVRLEERDDAPAAGKTWRAPRASPRPRSGGARSRRPRRRRRASPLLEAPVHAAEVRERARRDRRTEPTSSRATASAASAFCTLWRPGTGSATAPMKSPAARSRRSGAASVRAPRSRDRDVGLRREAVRHDAARARAAGSPATFGSSRPRITAPKNGTLSAKRANVSWMSVEVAVGVEVLEVDVGDDREHRREREERAVELVGLGDEVVAGPRRAVPPTSRSRPPTMTVGSRPAALEDRCRHRGRRRLAVRAGDRDAALEAHHLGEHLGAA